MQLHGRDLRALITHFLLTDGPSTTADLRRRLTSLGVDLGPDPRRLLFGALRSETYMGRVRRCGPGRYAIDHIPRSTRYRLQTRARDVEAALASGQAPPPRPVQSLQQRHHLRQ